MANPEALELWQIMKRDPANKICIECGASDPQWASVSLGTLFCLECSGIHRSLGVHISFVRSCTMDKWSEQQLSMMRAGGNAKCKQFFQKHGVSNDLKITERYSTGVAKAYKDMIKAQAEDRDFDEPRVGTLSTVPEVATRSISSNSLNSPNSGNKYTGMGTPLNNQKQPNNEWSDMFQTGFSAISSFAIATASSTSQLAKTAAEKISETQITQKVKETDWSAKVNELSTTIADKSVSGWSSFSSFISSVKSDLLGDENNKNPQSDSQQNNNNNNNPQRNFGDDFEQPRPLSNSNLQPTNNNSKSNHSDNDEWGDWEDKFESQWDDNMDAEPVVNKSSQNQSDKKEAKKEGWDDDDDVDGWEDWDPKKK